MALVVQKYGGTSLATPKHIRKAAERIRNLKGSGVDVIVVVSAMGRMTDHLIRLAQRTVAHPPQRELDMLMTAGERVSMSLLAMALHELKIPAISFTGSQSGIVTSPHHNDAKIIDIRAHRIRDELTKGKVVIIAGFQGVSLEKEVTTLGRGGSDTTAVAMAASLGAERCEILTDVDGLFTADPRIIPQARLIEHCSHDVALELASLGAKMQTRSLELARRYNVVVRITSSLNLESPGTELKDPGESPTQATIGERNAMEETRVRGIATKEGYHYFCAKIELAALLKRLNGHSLPLRFFHYAEGEVSFLCESDRVAALKGALNGVAFTREVAKVAIVSAVVDGIACSSEVLPQFLDALHASNVDCLLLCSNSLSITAAVDNRSKAELAQQLHARLVERK